MQTGNMKAGTCAQFSYFNSQNSLDTAFNCHTPMDSVKPWYHPTFRRRTNQPARKVAFGNSFQNSSHCKTIPPDVIQTTDKSVCCLHQLRNLIGSKRLLMCVWSLSHYDSSVEESAWCLIFFSSSPLAFCLDSSASSNLVARVLHSSNIARTLSFSSIY
jgi:hypothetical protein